MSLQSKKSHNLRIYLLFLLMFSPFSLSEQIEIRVNSDNNDAEELLNDGSMYRDSSDLELGYDSYVGGIQIIGMRFKDVDIPQGAIIDSAYIELTTDERDSGTTNLIIYGEDTDSSNIFSNNDNDISDRTTTSTSVNWAPSAWNSVNETHQSPDISAIIQEIVNRSNWSAENDLTIIIEPDSSCTSSSCQRTAESHDGESNSAPLLVINYTEDKTIVLPDPIVNYHFDECTYTGAENEVIDQSENNYHATTTGITSSREGEINSGLNLLNSENFTTMPKQAIQNVNDFTASFWIRTSYSEERQEVINAIGRNRNDDQLEIALNEKDNNTDSDIVYVKVGDEATELFSYTNLTDGEWHHLVITRHEEDACLFVDGDYKYCKDGVDSDSISAQQSIIIGQEYDSYNYDFTGLIDEFKIFEEQLDSTEVATLYNYESSGLNYDGTTSAQRSCDIEPLAEWRMDETQWSGNGNPVVDQTGNYDGTTKGASPANENPAIYGDPGTCGYGEFDDSYIEVSSFPNLQNSFTITAWINPTNLDKGSRIFADDENNTGGYSLSLSDDANNSGKLRFYSRNVRPISVDTNDGVIETDKWTFVAAVHNSETQTREIFVNGVAQQVTGGNTSNTYTGNWGVDTGVASIGGETNRGETNNRFTGNIDELRIYEDALSASEISAIYTDTHACTDNTTIDHYEIQHDGYGLTCEAEDITIKACMDEDCSVLSSEEVTLDLQYVTTAGSEATSNIVFTGSSNISINHTTPEALTLSIANESIAAINGSECSGGNDAEQCEIVFTDAGFTFSKTSATNANIENQASAEPFTVYLRAVENVDGVCEGLFNGNKNISLSQENVAPNTTGGLNLTLDGTSSTNQTIDKYPAYTDVSLRFDASSEATLINSTYFDAGEISLHAKYNESDVSLIGQSNDFWVTPSYLSIFAQSDNVDIDGASASTSTVHKAGVDFTLKVSAHNSNGQITQNYSPGNIQLKLTRTAPTDTASVDGRLTYAAGTSLSSVLADSVSFNDALLTDFANGVSTYTAAQFSEVGLINLDIQDNAYADNSEQIPSKEAINIGRFTPAYFEITSTTDGSLSGGNPFVYTGQLESTTSTEGEISYIEQPAFIITAREASGLTTQNYMGDFMKLLESDITRVVPDTDSSQNGVDGLNKVGLTANLASGKIVETDVLPGLIQYLFDSSDNYIHFRDDNTIIAPYTAAIDLQITSIIDDDGIEANDTDNNTSNGIITLQPEGVEIRFGRWLMENSYGAETSEQRIPMQTQYWDGSYFITNSNDSYSSFVASDATVTENNLTPTAGNPSLSGAGNFNNGETNILTVSPPGTNIRGPINVEFDVPTWLEFDWNNDADGTYDDNPSSQVNFGLYRGNDRVIYRRQSFE